MCLLDTLDGALMMSLYTSTRLAKDIISVFYFQSVLTGITVIVAIVIGTLQFLSMLQGATGLTGGFWDGVVRASDNYDIIGTFLFIVRIFDGAVANGVQKVVAYVAPLLFWAL